MRNERNFLATNAYPKIKAFCAEQNLDFKIMDMRWGITDDATNEHITEHLCLQEIAKCQRLSLGPNFIVSFIMVMSTCTTQHNYVCVNVK